MGFTWAGREFKARRGRDIERPRETQYPAEPPLTRAEPQSLAGRTAVADPYSIWLAEQSARRRDAEPIRWVYNYPRVTRPAAELVVRGEAGAAGAGVLAPSKRR